MKFRTKNKNIVLRKEFTTDENWQESADGAFWVSKHENERGRGCIVTKADISWNVVTFDGSKVEISGRTNKMAIPNGLQGLIVGTYNNYLSYYLVDFQQERLWCYDNNGLVKKNTVAWVKSHCISRLIDAGAIMTLEQYYAQLNEKKLNEKKNIRLKIKQK